MNNQTYKKHKSQIRKLLVTKLEKKEGTHCLAAESIGGLSSFAFTPWWCPKSVVSFGDIPTLPTLSNQVSKLISRQEIKTGPGGKGRGGEEGIRKEERGRGRKREKRGIGLPSKAKAASTTPAQTPGSGTDTFRSRQAKFPAAPYIIPIQ